MGQSRGQETLQTSPMVLPWWGRGLEIPQNLPALKLFQGPIRQINCHQHELSIADPAMEGNDPESRVIKAKRVTLSHLRLSDTHTP